MRLDTSSQVIPLHRKAHPVSINNQPEPARREGAGDRTYRVQVAGKVFQGRDLRTLLRLAVAAKRPPVRC